MPQGGPITYLVEGSPSGLPPVRSAELADAWSAAREAAVGLEWGPPRVFRFKQEDGQTLDLALGDEDACCWAAAVDQTAGIQTAYGLSLCLRLLALVDLIARASWLSAFYRIGRAGAALDPALVRAAATTTLTNDASFDEQTLRERLANSPAARPQGRLKTGANA